jgi:hypothetical protein
MKNRDADKTILRILERQSGEPPAACPDADILAAYLEARLTDSETDRFEEHAANCEHCCQALALAMKLGKDEEAAKAAPVMKIEKSYRTSPLRYALGAVMVLVVGVMLFQAIRQSNLSQETIQVAGSQRESDISGGPDAAMRSADAKLEAPAAPLSGLAVGGVGAPTREEPSSAKPEAAPAAPMQAQAANEPGAQARPRAADAVEEARIRVPTDLAADTRRGKGAAPEMLELKMAAAEQPKDEKAKPVPVTETRNQVASRTDAMAQMANQNIPVAPTANIANQQLLQTVQADRQIGEVTERAAQAQAVGGQAGGGGRGSGGAQQAAEAPMRFSEIQRGTMPTAAESGAAKSARVSSPSTNYFAPMPSFRLSQQVLPQERADFFMILGNRTFYQMTDSWMDVSYASHAGAASREIARSSKEFADMLRAEPGLAPLRSLDVPILIYWEGTNYRVR